MIFVLCLSLFDPFAGKLYWSKVCFVKHLWEHSVYWDVFKGAKNHERVLSIQAALILYSGCQSSKTDSVNNISPTLTNDENSFDNLVVTSPNKKEKDGCLAKNVEKSQAVASATSVKRKLCSPLKAKQNNEKTDGVHGDSRNMNGVENKNTKPNTPRKQKLSQPLLQTPQKRRRNFSGGSDSGVECPAEILT